MSHTFFNYTCGLLCICLQSETELNRNKKGKSEKNKMKENVPCDHDTDPLNCTQEICG